THNKPRDRRALTHPSKTIPREERMGFQLGKAIFGKLWVPAPSSTRASDGLGPHYSGRSCEHCHKNNGRGHAPINSMSQPTSMFLKLSVPPQTVKQKAQLAKSEIGVIPSPNYGTQLQQFAIAGLAAEGRFKTQYTTITITLAGGETVELQKPNYTLYDLAYGQPDPQLMISPRIAQPIIGMGLLDRVNENDILRAQDPDDIDNNGISGRANRVWSPITQKTALGRFGWKATAATLRTQNNSALHSDIGISNPDFVNPLGDCTPQQTSCAKMPHDTGIAAHHHNNQFEATEEVVKVLLNYTANLAVPARPNAHAADILAGKEAFYTAGCQQCHRPSLPLKNDASGETEHIWPYSDLLLHDMGEGLADNRPEFAASGREWRTQPLWGIGTTATVNKHYGYLHDGRARSLMEAILWHGGEAEASKQHIIAMPKAQRDNLIKFLESL
ncbi:MAG: di-heme oxidoredictase family protein, partial [Pontibacterium sp.]